MNKKTKGIVAGIAGGVLLLGAGGTFALWSDSDTVQGGTITAGTMDIEAVSEGLVWYDSSPDGSGAGPSRPLISDGAGNAPSWSHVTFSETTTQAGNPTDFEGLMDAEADMYGTSTTSSWRVVPGDIFTGVATFEVTLDGDNLEAGVTVTAPDGQGALLSGLGLQTFAVANDGSRDNGAIVPEWDNPFYQGVTAVNLGESFTLELDGPGTHEIDVFVVGNLPSSVTGIDFATTTAALGNLNVTLDQVRPAFS